MSYCLLNRELAYSTNLLRDITRVKPIGDLYYDLLGDVKPHMSKFGGEELFSIVDYHLTRKLMKQVYMPLVSGPSQ